VSNRRLISELLYGSIHYKLVSLGLIVSLILTPLIIAPNPQPAYSSISIVPPPDKTVPAAGSSSRTLTKVSLGSPQATDTSGGTLSISNNAPGSAPVPFGEASYWSFDNDLKDTSGNGNNAEAKGDARIVSSHMGRALLLDGDKDYATVKDSSSLDIDGAFTLSAWIKFDTLTPSGQWLRILEKGSSPGEKYWMFYIKSSKQIGFGFINSVDDVQLRSLKTNWEANRWYHIVATYDPSLRSNNMKIYVDGSLDNQETKTGKPSTNSKPLVIGARSDAGWDFWEGEIDELRIYKRSIGPTEVNNLYKSPFGLFPAGTNIVTWTAKDSSGDSASSIQVVNVVDPTDTNPTTYLNIINKYVDSTSDAIFVTSKTHFNLDPQSSNGLQGSHYRYFKSSALNSLKPTFSSGTYFNVNGANGEYTVQYYSVDGTGYRESLKEETVILDNSPPNTSLSLVDTTTGKIRLSAKENTGGSGIGQASTSGIYYKLDSAQSYTYVQSGVKELTNVANGAHTVYYYSVDNLGNKEVEKSSTFSGGLSYTFCSSGCDYSNLQTAINALPAGGGKIFIKDGIYSISNSIILKSGTILEFSPDAQIQFTGSYKPLFKGTGINNVQILGGFITANSAGVKAIAFWDSKGITVDGTEMRLTKGNDSNAFYCIDCVDVFISNINAKTASRLIDIKTESRINDGLSRNIWIWDSFIEDTSVEGIRVAWSTGVHITGNTVTSTSDNGIDIGWSKDSEIRWNTLIDAGVPGGTAIHTDSADGALITNNYIDGSGMAGIVIFRASNIDVVENTIKNTEGAGVDIITSTAPSSYIDVRSNHIIAPGNHGIYVSPTQYRIEITDNKIEQLLDGKLGVFVNQPNTTTTVSANTVI
jgi:parallel beta-helix repeat protein